MFLLVDECCAKCLVRSCITLGHTAQRTVHVRGLGTGAPDHAIYTFAATGSAVIVTENIRDFVALGRKNGHPGMIFLPSVRPRVQARILRDVIRLVAMPVFKGTFPGRFIEAASDGRIVSFI